MRANFVFSVLLVVTQIACYNAFANAEELNAVTHRNLKGSVVKTTAGAEDVNDEERGGLDIVKRWSGFFKRNPEVSKKVESLQKNPSMAKSLEKATMTEKSAGKLRAYFQRLSKNSSKAEKFFIYSTLLLFALGVGVTWGKLLP